MDSFEHLEQSEPTNECFFTKLLRECSMEQENPFLEEKPLSNKESGRSKGSKEDILPIEQFDRWKGI